MNENDVAARARPPLPPAYPRAEVYASLARDPLHQALRAFDDRFLAANRDVLRDYQAHWVADPLHHWSRRWEYPYVFEQLLRFDEGVRGSPAAHPGRGAQRSGGPDAAAGAGHTAAVAPLAPGQAGSAGAVAGLRILDAGSGLTFFPHFVAQELGAVDVQCCDRDPAMERDARRLKAPASPVVHYSTQDLARLSFADEAFDCTYCISVLEHTAERDRIVDEFWRTLRPGGLLVVTIDVSLDGQGEIPREEAAQLIAQLERRFRPLEAYAAAIAQPGAGVLTTSNVERYAPDLKPPRTYASAGGVARRLLKPHTFPWGKALRRLVGRGSGSAASELTFFCTAWRKASGPEAAGSPAGTSSPGAGA